MHFSTSLVIFYLSPPPTPSPLLPSPMRSFEFREPATMWLWLHLKLARPVLVQRPEGHRKPPNTRVFQAKEADSLNPTRLCRW